MVAISPIAELNQSRDLLRAAVTASDFAAAKGRRYIAAYRDKEGKLRAIGFDRYEEVDPYFAERGMTRSDYVGVDCFTKNVVYMC